MTIFAIILPQPSCRYSRAPDTTLCSESSLHLTVATESLQTSLPKTTRAISRKFRPGCRDNKQVSLPAAGAANQILILNFPFSPRLQIKGNILILCCTAGSPVSREDYPADYYNDEEYYNDDTYNYDDSEEGEEAAGREGEQHEAVVRRNPKFISQPKKVMVNEGDTIKLPCLVDKIDNFVILWKKKTAAGKTILTVSLGCF